MRAGADPSVPPQAGPARPRPARKTPQPWGSTPATLSARAAVWGTPPSRGCALSAWLWDQPSTVQGDSSSQPLHLSCSLGAGRVKCPSPGIQPDSVPHAQADAHCTEPCLLIISAHHLIPICSPAWQPGSLQWWRSHEELAGCGTAPLKMCRAFQCCCRGITQNRDAGATARWSDNCWDASSMVQHGSALEQAALRSHALISAAHVCKERGGVSA